MIIKSRFGFRRGFLGFSYFVFGFKECHQLAKGPERRLALESLLREFGSMRPTIRFARRRGSGPRQRRRRLLASRSGSDDRSARHRNW